MAPLDIAIASDHHLSQLTHPFDNTVWITATQEIPQEPVMLHAALATLRKRALQRGHISMNIGEKGPHAHTFRVRRGPRMPLV
jgi:hypothetical protein